VLLTQKHDSRQPLLAAALRHGVKFVDTFMKVKVEGFGGQRLDPIWDASAVPFNPSALQMKPWLKVVLASHPAEVGEMIKELQKATKCLQVVCAEGKARKMAVVTRRVPTAKRTLERFLGFVQVRNAPDQESGATWT